MQLMGCVTTLIYLAVGTNNLRSEEREALQ